VQWAKTHRCRRDCSISPDVVPNIGADAPKDRLTLLEEYPSSPADGRSRSGANTWKHPRTSIPKHPSEAGNDGTRNASAGRGTGRRRKCPVHLLLPSCIKVPIGCPAPGGPRLESSRGRLAGPALRLRRRHPSPRAGVDRGMDGGKVVW
jgi:hypothetical protein